MVATRSNTAAAKPPAKEPAAKSTNTRVNARGAFAKTQAAAPIAYNTSTLLKHNSMDILATSTYTSPDEIDYLSSLDTLFLDLDSSADTSHLPLRNRRAPSFFLSKRQEDGIVAPCLISTAPRKLILYEDDALP